MATGDSGNFAGALADIIQAEAIQRFVTAGVFVNPLRPDTSLVSVFSEPRADKISVPVWNDGTNQVTSADVASHSSGGTVSETALDSTKRTYTLAMRAINLPLHDEAKWSNVDRPEIRLGQHLGNALAADLDAQLAQKAHSFSNSVGTGSAEMKIDVLFDAMKTLRNNHAPGPYFYVGSTEQVWDKTYGLLEDFVNTSNFAGAPAQDEAVRNGYVGRLAGFDVLTTPEITGSVSASTPNADAIAGNKECLAFAWSGDDLIRVEEEREGSKLKSSWVGSYFGAAGVLADSYGVRVISRIG